MTVRCHSAEREQWVGSRNKVGQAGEEEVTVCLLITSGVAHFGENFFDAVDCFAVQLGSEC